MTEIITGLLLGIQGTQPPRVEAGQGISGCMEILYASMCLVCFYGFLSIICLFNMKAVDGFSRVHIGKIFFFSFTHVQF